MYESYIPSLSFLGQTEAEIKKLPPLPKGGQRPPRGGAMLVVGIGVALRVGVILFHYI